MGDLAGPVSESVLPKVTVLSVLIALCLPLAAMGASASVTGTSDAENVTIYRATDVDFDDAAAIEAAIENGSISPTDAMAAGETLVVGIVSERLSESLAAGNGSATRRFFDVLDGEAEFRLVQTNMNSHSPPKVPPMGPENVTVYRNGSTTYALVDISDLSFHRYLVDEAEYEPDQLRDGDQFAVEFGYDLDEVPFHGATYWDPAGPEVTLYTAESELPGTETPPPTATASRTATATPVISATSETTASPPSATDGEGNGFTPMAVFAALFLLIRGTTYRT